MSIKQHLPKLSDVRPRLTVIGVGGAGCNAINNMIASGLDGVDFVVANTDAQALASSSAELRLQLGATLTEGLGAGSKPEIGEAAAEEAIEDIKALVAGSHMVFIAAGMGGGTGTGAAAVIARAAKEQDILTVGVVTKPFLFEGARRMRIAEAGIAELKPHVDTLIVIPNQNLFRIASEKTTFSEAFVMADQVLYSGVACIVDLIIKEGLINLDFADVRTVMSGMGTAMMGTGEGEGEGRATAAAEEAISNPLLDDVSLRGAKGLLLSIIGGRNLTLYDVDEAASRVRQEVDPEANIIVGATYDEKLGDRVRVSIVASGMSRAEAAARAGRAGRAGSADTADAEPGDAQRRLSQALQESQPASHRTPAFGAHANDAEPAPHRSKEPWQAPGNVFIEEGPPVPASAYRPPALPEGAAGPAADGFTPAPPNEIRRPARRMPEIDDFPPVGQRVLNAMDQGQRSQPEAPRRPGILERLATRVLRDRDSAAGRQQAAQAGERSDPRRARAPGRAPAIDSASGLGDDDSQGHQEAELPVFFRKERR